MGLWLLVTSYWRGDSHLRYISTSKEGGLKSKDLGGRHLRMTPSTVLNFDFYTKY